MDNYYAFYYGLFERRKLREAVEQKLNDKSHISFIQFVVWEKFRNVRENLIND